MKGKVARKGRRGLGLLGWVVSTCLLVCELFYRIAKQVILSCSTKPWGCRRCGTLQENWINKEGIVSWSYLPTRISAFIRKDKAVCFMQANAVVASPSLCVHASCIYDWSYRWGDSSVSSFHFLPLLVVLLTLHLRLSCKNDVRYLNNFFAEKYYMSATFLDDI